MAERERDYAIGYGKPPAHSRFRKGRSGNPGGRPRGKSLATLLREALSETVTIELGGRRRRFSKGEAIIARLVDGAIEADPRSSRLLFQLALKLDAGGRHAGWEDEDEDDPDGEEAREFLLQELDRLAKEVVEEDDNENAQALDRLATRETDVRSRAAVATRAERAQPCKTPAGADGEDFLEDLQLVDARAE